LPRSRIGYRGVVSARLLSRRYQLPAVPMEASTDDGVDLMGSRIGGGGPSLIFCHGFLGWHRKPKVVAFVEQLAQHFVVYAFDFRGHGESGGLSTYGDLEYLDVDAVVRLARMEREDPVVTMGVSMGGIAVLRHAAYRGGVDVVVAVSTPSRWDGHRSRSMRRIRRITSTRTGRRMARLAGYRLAGSWSDPEHPEDVVSRIAPIPLVLVHGTDDHFFEVEDAHRLYERAKEPKRLMLSSRFGHAEDGLNRLFAERITRRIHQALRPTPAS
jgi:pimeloyl-ACP methyl ester carboxylesterase